jgi:hypothetical protein
MIMKLKNQRSGPKGTVESVKKEVVKRLEKNTGTRALE